jgi:asparagine synthase (glutamine-hydrolysing)
VLLTGIGGDEIFWGYSWVAQAASRNQLVARHPFLRRLAGFGSGPASRWIVDAFAQNPHAPTSLRRGAEILRDIGRDRTPKSQLSLYAALGDFRDAFAVKGGVYGSAMRDLGADNPFRPTEIGSRRHDEMPAAVTRMLFDTWLVSNCLSLGDRVSMAVGVESRLPFLDVRLIELVMALRARQPDHELGQKAWLRAALKGILPDDVLARPKAGFQPPVWEWLSGVVTAYGDVLRGGRLVGDRILEVSKVDAILEKLPKQGWPGLFFAYKLVLLETWYKQVVVA